MSAARGWRRVSGAAWLAAVLLGGCSEGVMDPVLQDGGFLSLAVGGEHACGTSVGGALFCWGSNRFGQLGTGDVESAWVPVRASSSARFAAVSAGQQHTCALDAEGGLWCWGENTRGQLGNASRQHQARPVAIAPEQRFAHVSAGWQHTCALTAAGDAYCWGAAGQSQVGGAAGEDVLTPRHVETDVRLALISAGGFHTCALDVEGAAWCWGANQYGQLGDGTLANRTEPSAVSGAMRFTSISAGYSHTCAVRLDGVPFCWGSSERGELGTGGVAPPGMPGAAEPVGVRGPILAHSSAAAIAAGYYATCMASSALLGWCWGQGLDGQLGTGMRRDAWTPQYVSEGIVLTNEPDFIAVGMGLRHACGLTPRGVAYCWGHGRSGQLGAGSLTQSDLAVRVGGSR